MTQKNLLGKSRSIQNPYAIYKGQGPFGNTEMHLLKTYQVPANEVKNQYARWFVAVKSDMTHGSYGFQCNSDVSWYEFIKCEMIDCGEKFDLKTAV